MKKIASGLLAILVCASTLPAAAAPARWVEGTHYVVLDNTQPTTVPAGKVEVMEVFSYACPFGVATQMREADAQIMSMEIPGTPCIVVDGKYRIVMDSLRSPDQVIDLVKFLVAKASAR